MPKTLLEYAMVREPSRPLRIFVSDKPRFDELQQRLVVAVGGVPLSQAQVVRIMLDMVDGMEDFINQVPPTAT